MTEALFAGTAVAVASGALALALLIRAAYVAPLLFNLGRRVRHGARFQDRVAEMESRLADGDPETVRQMRRRTRGEESRLEQFREREDPEEANRLFALLAEAAGERTGIEAVETQRTALLAVRDEGTFSSTALDRALATLDAQQIGMELSRPAAAD